MKFPNLVSNAHHVSGFIFWQIFCWNLDNNNNNNNTNNKNNNNNNNNNIINQHSVENKTELFLSLNNHQMM